LSPIDRRKFTDRITGRQRSKPDELLAADRSKPIPERHLAIQRIYADLEARRATLKSDDKIALTAYARDETRYQELLTALQADAATEAAKAQ
jgi:hypothetical protein